MGAFVDGGGWAGDVLALVHDKNKKITVPVVVLSCFTMHKNMTSYTLNDWDRFYKQIRGHKDTVCK